MAKRKFNCKSNVKKWRKLEKNINDRKQDFGGGLVTDRLEKKADKLFSKINKRGCFNN